MDWYDKGRFVRVGVLITALVTASAAGNAHATICGSATYPFPFTDVGGVSDAFCRGIMEAYVLGVTLGTTATTFSPNDNVPRLQMTTFLQRSIDQGLKRNSRRAALGQWWTPRTSARLQTVQLPGAGPAHSCRFDGERVWVGNGANLLSVQPSTGEVQAVLGFGFVPPLVTDVSGVLVANGHVFAVAPASQAFINTTSKWGPDFHGGTIVQLQTFHPNTLSFDGDSIWTANYSDGTLTIDPSPGANITVTGFTLPIDLVFDGVNMWVAESQPANRIRRLSANGAVLQSVAVGAQPGYMVYDGANIWVPSIAANSITVVRASTGVVVATIASDASNRLSSPVQAAFDGERILVTNPGNDSVTLFRAADMSLIGNVQLAAGSYPFGACSDGINFWVTLRLSKQLLRL